MPRATEEEGEPGEEGDQSCFSGDPALLFLQQQREKTCCKVLVFGRGTPDRGAVEKKKKNRGGKLRKRCERLRIKDTPCLAKGKSGKREKVAWFGQWKEKPTA